MKDLSIGVVGGSIVGCAAAIEAGRRGFHVDVFERSAGKLEDRGAGIGVPTPTLQSLLAQDLVDKDFPYLSVRALVHTARSDSGELLGRVAGEIPTWMEALRWGDLYTNLRKRVSDSQYHAGTAVTDVRASARQVEITVESGARHAFDLAVFADGHRSIGRPKLDPDCRPEYRGYVIWRGIVDESAIGDRSPLEGRLQRVGVPGGHLFAYLVPGQDGSTERGGRQINWGLYLPVDASALDAFFTDRSGVPRSYALPPGTMRPTRELELRAFAKSALPPYHFGIVDASVNTFAQAIYTAAPQRYRSGRECLVGDAGAVVQPITTSGVFKGMRNAVELIDALARSSDVDEALEQWDRKQIETARGLTHLGEVMERALITQVPDFSTMAQDSLTAWWEETSRALTALRS